MRFRLISAKPVSLFCMVKSWGSPIDKTFEQA